MEDKNKTQEVPVKISKKEAEDFLKALGIVKAALHVPIGAEISDPDLQGLNTLRKKIGEALKRI